MKKVLLYRGIVSLAFLAFFSGQTQSANFGTISVGIVEFLPETNTTLVAVVEDFTNSIAGREFMLKNTLDFPSNAWGRGRFLEVDPKASRYRIHSVVYWNFHGAELPNTSYDPAWHSLPNRNTKTDRWVEITRYLLGL